LLSKEASITEASFASLNSKTAVDGGNITVLAVAHDCCPYILSVICNLIRAYHKLADAR
jgi:hypothetical protein